MIKNLAWEKLIFFGVLIFASFVFFYKLSTNRLIEYDEGIYALVAKNILASGDWFTLHWRLEVPWFDKGPLMLWLIALAFKLLGLNELAARLPSALLGFLTVLSVYFIGRRLFDRWTGLTSSLVLASTVGFVYYARLGMLDVPNAAFNSLSLLFLIYSLEDIRFLPGAAAILALGFLNRGPLAFFGLISFIIYCFLSKVRPLLSRRAILISLTVFLVISLPWHLVETWRWGIGFWQVYLGHQVFSRFAQTIEGKSAPLWWYLTVIRTHFRIWLGVLAPALIFSFYSFYKKKWSDFLILVWALLTFGLLSVAQSKLIWYILPVYPPLALICGRFLSQLGGWIKRPVLVVLAVFLLSVFYDFKNWNKIQTIDFNQDLFRLIEFKNKASPHAAVLDVSYGPSVTSFYADGPVSQIPLAELPGLLNRRSYAYALISRGDLKSLMRDASLPPNLFKVAYASGDGLLVMPASQ